MLAARAEPRLDPDTVRVDVPVARLGLSPPPEPLQMWWIEHKPLRLYAQCAPGRAPRVARWLSDNGVADVEQESSLSPRTVWGNAPSAPKSWARILADPDLRRADLHASGMATLILDAPTPADLPALQDLEDSSRCRVALLPARDLTRRQREVMAAAVALGYYEVPRLASVRDVAAAVDLSPAATSELLRRGERVLVAGHFDQAGIHGRTAGLWIARQDNTRPLLVPERVRVAPP